MSQENQGTVLERSRAQRPYAPSPVTTASQRRSRVAYLDNLKLLLVAVIIAGHGAVAYGDLESAWPIRTFKRCSWRG
jgi:hypothetical protein